MRKRISRTARLQKIISDDYEYFNPKILNATADEITKVADDLGVPYTLFWNHAEDITAKTFEEMKEEYGDQFFRNSKYQIYFSFDPDFNETYFQFALKTYQLQKKNNPYFS